MSVLHIKLACSLEMMMHITLMKMRKFTWRNGRRIYITINKPMCLSTQKGWFVYACVALCASCYAAAAEFATELNSLLRNCGLNVNAKPPLKTQAFHYTKQGTPVIFWRVRHSKGMGWPICLVWRSEPPDTVWCLQNISTQCHTFCSSFAAQYLK